jgi:hypothetical protein
MRRWRVESIRRVHQLQVAQPDQGRLILTEHHPAGVFRRPEFNLFSARALRYRIFGVLALIAAIVWGWRTATALKVRASK